jgi:hypothetical protein
MYTSRGMEQRLRKGDVGEAIFREWFDRILGECCARGGYRLDQQGFNPGGLIERGEKDLKAESDPDFAIYSVSTSRPVIGISVNTQEKFYNADNAMGKLCIRCPRAMSCYDGNEANLWFNKYNLSDYAKFEKRLNVETCMVTLKVAVSSAANWLTENSYERLIHSYIFDGGISTDESDKSKIEALVEYLRHGTRRSWDRPVEVRWVLRSELQEITSEVREVSEGSIAFWTTGGRVQFGRPRPVCCVDSKLAHGEKSFIEYIAQIISHH